MRNDSEYLTSDERAGEAKDVIERCKTEDGFLASAHLYKELWLRDLVYSENSLLKLGYHETVRKHLITFLKYQQKNGQIPSVISRGWKRIMSQRFHFWTADTEILLVLGMTMYAKTTEDLVFLEENRRQIEVCVEFITRRVNNLGLVPGLDWRDAVINYYQRRKYLLSNQVLLAQMYDGIGKTEDAKSLKETIREQFITRPSEVEGRRLGYPVDCIWWDHENQNKKKEHELKFEDRLDCLGSSLAILSGIISGDAAVEVARNLNLTASTKYGYRNLTPPLHIERLQAFASTKAMRAFARNGAFFRNRSNHYQNSAVWPFVEARLVSAFRKIGLSQEAAELSKLMLERKEFNEWYSPINGRAKGSRDQLWTASAVLDQII